MNIKSLTLIIVAIALTGCGPSAAKFKRNSHGPLFFDYAQSHPKNTTQVDPGPCPVCGGDETDEPNGGNSLLNDDRTDGDQHADNGEDNNDHEAQHDEQCAPISNG